jgi:hypothetical protein
MIQGVIARIIADSTCQTLIGQYQSTYKVYPVVAEQECPKPYVLLRRIGVQPAIEKTNVSGMDNVNFTIASYGERYKVAADILAAIRTAVDNFSGTSGTIVFERIWYATSEDLFDKDDNSFVIVDTYTARVKR